MGGAYGAVVIRALGLLMLASLVRIDHGRVLMDGRSLWAELSRNPCGELCWNGRLRHPSIRAKHKLQLWDVLCCAFACLKSRRWSIML